MARVEPVLVDTSFVVTFVDTSIFIRQGRKSISIAVMDDHMVIVSKASVHSLVY